MDAAGSSRLMPVCLVAVGQLRDPGNPERKWPCLFASELVVLGVTVAVGGEDVFGVEALAFGVALGLLHSF